MMKKIGFAILVIFCLSSIGCYYDDADLLANNNVDCNAVDARFVNVQPIIISNCATAGCHDARSAAGNTVLQTHEQISAKAARINIRVIVEGNMPPAKQLSTTQSAIVKCWIDAGAPNN